MNGCAWRFGRLYVKDASDIQCQAFARRTGCRRDCGGQRPDSPIAPGKKALRCIQKRKFKATTNSNHRLPVADNLLNQEFKPTDRAQVWVSDITYVQTDEGWLYLAGIKDVFTCEIVGYAMGSRMTQELIIHALWKAVKWKQPDTGLILHSDRGSQYCSHGYRKLIDQFGLRVSMSRRNCYDNALDGASGAA